MSNLDEIIENFDKARYELQHITFVLIKLKIRKECEKK